MSPLKFRHWTGAKPAASDNRLVIETIYVRAKHRRQPPISHSEDVRDERERLDAVAVPTPVATSIGATSVRCSSTMTISSSLTRRQPSS
jgi:hypothetical protein